MHRNKEQSEIRTTSDGIEVEVIERAGRAARWMP